MKKAEPTARAIQDLDTLYSLDTIRFEGGEIHILDKRRFQEETAPILANSLIFRDDPELQKECLRITNAAAREFGIFPASIASLYRKIAQEDGMSFTVPAINLRTLTFDLSRAVFRAAIDQCVGAFIFEIARSEIGYTGQRPREYSAQIILAAIREGFRGPVFIQGDHFQVSADSFAADAAGEIRNLKDLAEEAVSALFYNIDIDSSTLVDLSYDNIEKQQLENAWVCADLTRHIRKVQPAGIEISVGGEIGEVGGHNSTPEELRAFMKGYIQSVGSAAGLSKISIQTGTSHGGVVLPDGTIADAHIDFDTLRELSRIARREFGMAGAVQHGASTLPREAFGHFPENECAEIHLATQFQNIVYDCLPEKIRSEIYQWLKINRSSEKKDNQTEKQFLYKTRKKALGPFRKKIHALPDEVIKEAASRTHDEIAYLFTILKVKGTHDLVNSLYNSPEEIG